MAGWGNVSDVGVGTVVGCQIDVGSLGGGADRSDAEGTAAITEADGKQLSRREDRRRVFSCPQLNGKCDRQSENVDVNDALRLIITVTQSVGKRILANESGGRLINNVAIDN